MKTANQISAKISQDKAIRLNNRKNDLIHALEITTERMYNEGKRRYDVCLRPRLTIQERAILESTDVNEWLKTNGFSLYKGVNLTEGVYLLTLRIDKV